jgi:hypothetical protein
VVGRIEPAAPAVRRTVFMIVAVVVGVAAVVDDCTHGIPLQYK